MSALSAFNIQAIHLRSTSCGHTTHRDLLTLFRGCQALFKILLIRAPYQEEYRAIRPPRTHHLYHTRIFTAGLATTMVPACRACEHRAIRGAAAAWPLAARAQRWPFSVDPTS
jgi:hypothetical protein